jgi:hypothetical protein
MAAVVLQAGQALLWLLLGLILAIGYSGVRTSDVSPVSEPVAVVLVIAAILAFVLGGFVLALAAGTLRRSDVCRIASVIVQCVFGVLILAGSVKVIHDRTGLTIALDPAAGPTFLLTPAFIGGLMASCVAVAVLLLCRPSTRATRVRYRRRYR